MKKGDIVLMTTVGRSPMGGKKLAEVLQVNPGKLVDLTGVCVYVFAWKQTIHTFAMHITEISDGEMAIHRLGER